MAKGRNKKADKRPPLTLEESKKVIAALKRLEGPAYRIYSRVMNLRRKLETELRHRSASIPIKVVPLKDLVGDVTPAQRRQLKRAIDEMDVPALTGGVFGPPKRKG